MKTDFSRHISLRLARNALLVALAAGLVLILAELSLDLANERDRVRHDLEQTLGLVDNSAAQAAYQLDAGLARQVTWSLLEIDYVVSATIVDDFGNVMARAQRPGTPGILDIPGRLILGTGPEFVRPLTVARRLTPVGSLVVETDTGLLARDLVERAGLTLASEVLRLALLVSALYLVFHLTLARPLFTMVRDVSRLDPADPGAHAPTPPRGHENDELGLLARTITGVLQQFAVSLEWRRRAEREMAERERKYRLLAENAADIIWTMDADFNYTYVSPSVQRVLGYTAEEAMSMDHTGGLDPESVAQARAALISLKEEGLLALRTAPGGVEPGAVTHTTEVKFRHKNGSPVWTEVNLSPLYGPDGEFAGVLGVTRDATRRIRSEEALLRSEKELSVRNVIANIFLTLPDDQTFEAVLAFMLKSVQSPLGLFGTMDDSQRLSFPALTRRDSPMCRGNAQPDIHDLGTGIWDRLVNEQTPVMENSPGRVPPGHLPIERLLAHPVVHTGRVIGLMVCANKPEDYTPEDARLLSVMADFTSPILKARLDRDREEARRIKAHEKITRSLEEKEILLKEIHHRVKNNLQIISSLLSLQARHIHDPQDRVRFTETQARVRSMALVHEELYRTGDLARVDLAAYARRLMDKLGDAFAGDGNVTLDIEATEIWVSVDQAIPLGLILGELVMNAMQHAFVGRDQGQVGVEISGDSHTVRLVVLDNGVGIRPESMDSTDSLGMLLVDSLVGQLRGEKEIRVEDGTRVEIRFARESAEPDTA